MRSPLLPKDTEAALDALAPVLDKAIAHASGRDIDEQQVAVARLADLATELRAARDLLVYATGAGELEQEEAAVFAGLLASRVVSLVRDYADDHGLDDTDLPEVRDFTRAALAEGRLRAIGKAVADARGVNDCPLDEMHELTREAVREFALNEVLPKAEYIHRNDADLPEELIEKMSELGYFGLSIPEEYGGSEMGNLAMIVTTEELSRASLAAAGSLITRPEILAKALLAGGTDEQKKTWLPKLASGELMVGISVTEPDVGSDTANVRCRAEPASVDGVEGWEITGPKAWCTFAGRADILAVLLRTDPDLSKGRHGLSLFIVPKPRFSGHEFEYEQPGGGKLHGKADATPGYRGMVNAATNGNGAV